MNEPIELVEVVEDVEVIETPDVELVADVEEVDLPIEYLAARLGMSFGD